jgi:hypothetical protein
MNNNHNYNKFLNINKHVKNEIKERLKNQL